MRLIGPIRQTCRWPARRTCCAPRVPSPIRSLTPFSEGPICLIALTGSAGGASEITTNRVHDRWIVAYGRSFRAPPILRRTQPRTHPARASFRLEIYMSNSRFICSPNVASRGPTLTTRRSQADPFWFTSTIGATSVPEAGTIRGPSGPYTPRGSGISTRKVGYSTSGRTIANAIER